MNTYRIIVVFLSHGIANGCFHAHLARYGFSHSIAKAEVDHLKNTLGQVLAHFFHGELLAILQGDLQFCLCHGSGFVNTKIRMFFL